LRARLHRLRYRRLAPWLAVPVVLASAGYVGATQHPVPQPPSEVEAATEIAAVFSESEQPAGDLQLEGDLLIERFYTLDLETGQLKIADVCKGRVRDVIAAPGGDWVGYRYTLVLDRTGLSAEAARVAAFVRRVVPPEARQDGAYLGLRVPGGTYEVFSLNYDGSLPDQDVVFTDEDGRDAYAFLREQSFEDVTRVGMRLIGVEGNNFLLSNTELHGGFPIQFGTKRALLLGELILVDATSPEQVRLYRDIALAGR
jgi:hypothetical protein